MAGPRSGRPGGAFRRPAIISIGVTSTSGARSDPIWSALLIDHLDGWISALAVAGEIVVGLVFARAAIPKLTHPRRFTAQVTAYGMLPRSASPAVASVIVATEICVVLSLLVGVAITSIGGLLLAGTVSSVFMAATLWQLRHGRDVACGCFDADEHVSGRSILRLALLLTLIAVLLVIAVSAGPVLSAATFLSTTDGARALGTALAAAAIISIGKSALALYDVIALTSSPGRPSSRAARRRGEGGG